MRSKLLLLLLLFFSGILSAQSDTIKTLIITEARLDRGDHSFCEITNMGDTAINLSAFEFGVVRPWTDPWLREGPDRWMMLPDYVLGAGESYVIAAVLDYQPEQFAIDEAKFGYSPRWNEFVTKPEMWEIVDLEIHSAESPINDPTDSVTTPHAFIMTDIWNGRETWYLRHFFTNFTDLTNPDSAVVDQVNGVFDNDGKNNAAGMYKVAGVEGATGNSILVRKFSVKEGNLDFNTGRGAADIAESEWIPIPLLRGNWEPEAAVFWTLGNHGNYTLDMLNSSTAQINYTDSIITVPWGVRNRDSLIHEFDRMGGIAWHYDFHGTTDSATLADLTDDEWMQMHLDSSFSSVRTGDVFTLYACGDSLQWIKLKVEVEDPLVTDNMVVPKYAHQANGDYRGSGIPYEVSAGIPGGDTISEVPFATRTDTLLKYLEKPPLATWEFVWVDGVPRIDVKDGDILRVTAEDGASKKDYYIKVQKYRKALNARLGAITWPDIPAYLYNLYDWSGDTIPNFVGGSYNYKVQLPFDMIGVPALVGITEDQNATVETKRAVHLGGSVAHRTVSFTVTAEDDTSQLVYNVVLAKEPNPEIPIQPWYGDPFISEVDVQEQWNNGFIEIVNPGNQPLDLSNYMFYGGWASTPADAITDDTAPEGVDWLARYRKYIPGYKWASDSATWKSDPAIAIKDLAVKSTVAAGDVFVMGAIWSNGSPTSVYGSDPNDWPSFAACDVVFNYPDTNYMTWNEPMNAYGCRNWLGASYYLYKILNDSIKAGTKPANDPNDFELIDLVGTGDGEFWVVGGKRMDQITSYRRKPHIYDGSLVFGESFAGSSPEDDSCEWIIEDRAFYDALNTPWPQDILYVTDNNLGHHFMSDVTAFQSTVASLYYKISQGFSMDESIEGVLTGTTVDGFLNNILKLDEDQTLTLKSATVLTGTDVLTDKDTLIVVSANGDNTSQYVLTVAAEGLSDNAVLTSSVYDIVVTGTTGTVSGMDFKTTLQKVLWDVDLPAGATMTPIDANDGFIPLKVRNFDTNYVDVMASDKIFLEVIAEDFVTKIVYQLLPTVASSDAFVTSVMFDIDQDLGFIKLIPGGTGVKALLANLTPATGASLQVYDKMGHERNSGVIYKDDKLVVTAQDGTTTKVYHFGMLQRIDDILPLYLAYVLSDVYTVDQFVYSIDVGIAASTAQVGILLFGLTEAPEATMEVQSSDGTVKAVTDVLAKGDVVVVTAADGVTQVVYEIVFDLTTVEDIGEVALNAYPNPSSGTFMIEGLEAGQRMRVFNSLGANILDIPVQQTEEEISLEGRPDGIYFISISKEDQVIGTLRLIKR